MISTNSDFNKNMLKIEDEINKYWNFSHIELFEYCIDSRLKNTLLLYNDEVDMKTTFLGTRSSSSILKAISKLQKKDDKQIIEANLRQNEKEDNIDDRCN